MYWGCGFSKMIAPVPNNFPGGDSNWGGRGGQGGRRREHANSFWLLENICVGHVIIGSSSLFHKDLKFNLSSLPPPRHSLSPHFIPKPHPSFIIHSYISEVSLQGWVGGTNMTNTEFNFRYISCKCCDFSNTLLLTVSFSLNGE